MKKMKWKGIIGLIGFITMIMTSTAYAQYNIVIKTTKPLKSEKCIIAYYFGDKQLVFDTFQVKKNTCVVKGDSTLATGVYIAYYPEDTVFIEFLMPKDDQKFTLTFDPDNPILSMEVKGSIDNQLFYEYNKKAAQLYKDSVAGADSIIISFGKSLAKKNPNTFFAKLIKLIYLPNIPDTLKDPEKIWKYAYYHYFDDIDLSDPSYLRTPVLHNKVMTYLDRIVPIVPDSQCNASVRIIKASEKNQTTFKYWVATLLNKYARSRIMGMENVYVCIVDSFYATGKTPWVDSITLSKILFDAQMIKYTMIGKVAPEIVLKDSAGRYISLHGINSLYTVILFWDPDCGHCRREMPKLKEIYKKYSRDTLEIYAVYVNVEKDKWLKYIREHKLEWINVEDVEMKHPFRYYYYIKGTPKILLLDKDKKIIAKNINAEQLEKILESRIKGKKTEEAVETTPEDAHH